MSLVDVVAVAEYLAVTPDWVYAHADDLGARRLGNGPKARLRFSLEEVDERLRTCSIGRGSQSSEKRTVEPIRRRRRARPLGTNLELLPIRGSGRPAK